MFARQQLETAAEEQFSAQSVPRCYKQDKSRDSQLRVAVAETGGSSGIWRKENVLRWKLLLSNG
jgi:hypothetical protein